MEDFNCCVGKYGTDTSRGRRRWGPRTPEMREAVMAKGQQRSNREVRKPKKDKEKPAAAPVSSFNTQMKNAETSTPKKR
jgi:predicted Fe-S protein YdhL (DUF1289 family)